MTDGKKKGSGASGGKGDARGGPRIRLLEKGGSSAEPGTRGAREPREVDGVPFIRLSDEEKAALRENILEHMIRLGLFSKREWVAAHKAGRLPSSLPRYPEVSLCPVFPGWYVMGNAARRVHSDELTGLSPTPLNRALFEGTGRPPFDAWLTRVRAALLSGEIEASTGSGYRAWVKRLRRERGEFLPLCPEVEYESKWRGWGHAYELVDPMVSADAAEEYRETVKRINLFLLETGGELMRHESRLLSAGEQMERRLLGGEEEEKPRTSKKN